MSNLISRDTVIELVHSLYPNEPIMRKNKERWKEKYKPYIETEKALKKLPSAQPDLDTALYSDGFNDGYAQGKKDAQPERQRGRWIEYIPEHGKCPFCGNQVDLLSGKANNFCGECGADMRGAKE